MIPRGLRRLGLRALSLAAAALALSGCYVPDNFQAEVRLGRTGDFALTYLGELTWAPLVRDIQQGKVSTAEIPGRVAEIENDLKRDPDFKVVKSLGEGRFKVEYRREGHLAPSQQVTFIRRNEIIMMLRASPDGRVTVNTMPIRPTDAQTLTQLGLTIHGIFHIITDGKVEQQNATTATTFKGYQLYIWKIGSAYAPSAHFVMQREGVWTAKPGEKK